MAKAGQYKRAGQPAASTLNKWWRQAIRVLWGERCAMTDGTCMGQLEAHHVKRRAKGVLSHDPKNGILLCTKHHAEADRSEGRAKVAELVDMEYLDAMDRYLLDDYLQARGLSNAEFRRGRLDELKRIVRFGR